MLPDGMLLVGCGVQPDIPSRASRSELNAKDLVLDAALHGLREAKK